MTVVWGGCRLRALVAGSGPAGSATALLLARYGVGVTLVERETSFARVFRGEGLMPLGIDALSEMGLRGYSSPYPGAGSSLGTYGSMEKKCSSYRSPLKS